MKIPALVTVLALACGTAFSAQYGNGAADRDAAASRNSAAVATDTQSDGAKGEGVVAKTKRALHRMGEKIRNATHGTASAGRDATERDAINEQAAKHDTRSMGAAGSDTQDSGRKRRMDDAYGNWQSKHK